ncbi:MAG: SRPBCC domain-containing protein [Acidobacteria bacterium]|nr:SRPBCC domain-containing protein [Acidobacteriota bacterium]
MLFEKLVLLAAAFSCFAMCALAEERVIRKQVVVDASLAEVWKAWTTSDGAATFFAPQANIEARLGGAYELYFFPDQPQGLRGAEGCQVHSIVPMKSLAFTWGAPPQFPDIRNSGLHTLVFLRFEELGPRKVRVHFTELGWGEGEQWDKVYNYFVEAWDVVLGRLKHRFASGPLDWAHPPRPTESLAAAK